MRAYAVSAVLLCSPLIGGSAARQDAAPDLAAAGWRAGTWSGVAPAQFNALPNEGVRVRGQGQGSFVWRPQRGAPQCLFWRWRVDAGPPPTRLDRQGGDDRALTLSVGFSGWPKDAGFWTRTQFQVAQAAAGEHPLPRSVLIYAWGGTGAEPNPFPSPYLHGLGQVRILQPASAQRGAWVEQRVDLAADWRASFGADPPPMQELAIGSDGDDTRSAVDAAVERIRFGPC
ncbi:DUF3047 domain-containing protein [Plastoroseomonas arctica]|uniref:DUF3047 domain-containing protein n=1 Tax=Plastoroseomonas arctica TaxID=1509237 RepID=A0AAF1KPW6_9PROT|nr:DUF3047 domain-containing protein [Plastoroseomonas arctica]MBR0656638.1 DUF3047 domain-containing protein [Plastoroseomonas arctica]